jgi:hypothetical protein
MNIFSYWMMTKSQRRFYIIHVDRKEWKETDGELWEDGYRFARKFT